MDNHKVSDITVGDRVEIDSDLYTDKAPCNCLVVRIEGDTIELSPDDDTVILLTKGTVVLRNRVTNNKTGIVTWFI